VADTLSPFFLKISGTATAQNTYPVGYKFCAMAQST